MNNNNKLSNETLTLITSIKHLLNEINDKLAELPDEVEVTVNVLDISTYLEPNQGYITMQFKLLL